MLHELNSSLRNFNFVDVDEYILSQKMIQLNLAKSKRDFKDGKFTTITFYLKDRVYDVESPNPITMNLHKIIHLLVGYLIYEEGDYRCILTQSLMED